MTTMAEKTTTTETKTDDKGNKTTTQTETERDVNQQPAAPAKSGAEKGGAGSQTNPSGIGGNNESVSG